MRASSTADISIERLRRLATDLGPDFQLQVDTNQMFFKSVGAPSWITFFADAPWWGKVLGSAVGVYLAGIIQEAGKDTWKSRGKVLTFAGDRIRQFAEALNELRQDVPPKTKIQIGLPLPDDYDGTRLELTGDNAEELAFQVALFLHHIPALVALMQEEQLDHGHVAAGVHLKLLGNGSMEVYWQDGASLERRTRMLEFS